MTEPFSFGETRGAVDAVTMFIGLGTIHIRLKNVQRWGADSPTTNTLTKLCCYTSGDDQRSHDNNPGASTFFSVSIVPCDVHGNTLNHFGHVSIAGIGKLALHMFGVFWQVFFTHARTPTLAY